MENERFQVPPGMSGGAVGPGMMSPQQALFMQQQGMGGARGPFSQQGPGSVLQGPLAYLEKTTSNIGTKTWKFKTIQLAILPPFRSRNGRWTKVTGAREGAWKRSGKRQRSWPWNFVRLCVPLIPLPVLDGP